MLNLQINVLRYYGRYITKNITFVFYLFFITKEAALTVALLPPCGAIPQADELKNKIAGESAP
ncbi:MAG: hypothetical protein LBO71_03655 [Prevotellaceae bacterium]|jgi:hypothetical protein|nr:hypothetical protein [Prevotellaceae bacterium]